MCNDDEVVVGVDVDGVFIVVVGRTKRHNVTKSQCVTLASTFNVTCAHAQLQPKNQKSGTRVPDSDPFPIEVWQYNV